MLQNWPSETGRFRGHDKQFLPGVSQGSKTFQNAGIESILKHSDGTESLAVQRYGLRHQVAAVWAKQVLKRIVQNGTTGFAETDLPSELEQALSNLEHLGLVENSNGQLHLSGKLFLAWLERRYKSSDA